MLNIPPSEVKVFVTKTKAPYMICLELYDPLEIIDEPLVLELRQNDDHLPSPARIPKILKRKQTMKKLVPNHNVLVLGTMPRNVVDLRLLEKKEDWKQKDEDDVITIAKSNVAKTKRRILRRQSIGRGNHGGRTLMKQKSSALDMPKWANNPGMKFSCKNLFISSLHSEGSPASVKAQDASIDPVLVVQDDVVTPQREP